MWFNINISSNPNVVINKTLRQHFNEVLNTHLVLIILQFENVNACIGLITCWAVGSWLLAVGSPVASCSRSKLSILLQFAGTDRIDILWLHIILQSHPVRQRVMCPLKYHVMRRVINHFLHPISIRILKYTWVDIGFTAGGHHKMYRLKHFTASETKNLHF